MSKLMTLGPVAANTNNQIPLPLRTRRKLNNAELLSCWIAGKSKPLDATSVPIKTSSEAPAQRNEGGTLYRHLIHFFLRHVIIYLVLYYLALYFVILYYIILITVLY